MSRFKHLEIFQKAYKLNHEIFRIKSKLPRALKYDLGVVVFKSSLRLIRGIMIANGSPDKLKILRQIALEIELIWVYFRMLYDFQGISRGEFQVLSEQLTEISKQNQNWIKWSKEQVNKNK